MSTWISLNEVYSTMCVWVCASFKKYKICCNFRILCNDGYVKKEKESKTQ